jgi:hypothetical protein
MRLITAKGFGQAHFFDAMMSATNDLSSASVAALSSLLR